MLYYFISKLLINDSYATMWWPIIGIIFYSILFKFLILDNQMMSVCFDVGSYSSALEIAINFRYP